MLEELESKLLSFENRLQEKARRQFLARHPQTVTGSDSDDDVRRKLRFHPRDVSEGEAANLVRQVGDSGKVSGISQDLLDFARHQPHSGGLMALDYKSLPEDLDGGKNETQERLKKFFHDRRAEGTLEGGVAFSPAQIVIHAEDYNRIILHKPVAQETATGPESRIGGKDPAEVFLSAGGGSKSVPVR